MGAKRYLMNQYPSFVLDPSDLFLGFAGSINLAELRVKIFIIIKLQDYPFSKIKVKSTNGGIK